MRLRMVDLPLPVLPIMAVVVPGAALKEIEQRDSVWAPGYLKSTSSKLISPLVAGSFFFSSGERRTFSVLSTSIILLAETEARGNIILNMVSMRNDMIIIIEYWMKAIMSPICIEPA